MWDVLLVAQRLHRERPESLRDSPASIPTTTVYGILETKPATHKQNPVTYRSIKARTFLDDLTAAGKNQLLLDVDA